MEFEQNNPAKIFRKFALSINLVTGAFLSLCYLEVLNVARIEYFSSYYVNLGFSIFFYSVVHTLMYFRIYLFVSKRYEKKSKGLAYFHSWAYAIVISLGIVGLVKFRSSI